MDERNEILGWGFFVVCFFALISVFDILLKYVSHLKGGITRKDNLLPHRTMCRHYCRPRKHLAKWPQRDTK